MFARSRLPRRTSQYIKFYDNVGGMFNKRKKMGNETSHKKEKKYKIVDDDGKIDNSKEKKNSHEMIYTISERLFLFAFSIVS